MGRTEVSVGENVRKEGGDKRDCKEDKSMLSATLLVLLALCVLLAQLILSRLSDSLLSLCDSAHTLSLLLVLCPPLILTHAKNSLTPHACLRLPTLFSLLSPLFLSSLSFSLVLGSLGRFVRPHPPHRPVLVFVAGLLGLGFNVLYIVITGAWQGKRLPIVAGVKSQHPRWLSILRLLAFFTPSCLLLCSSLSLHLLYGSLVLDYMDPALCLVSVTIMVAAVYSSMVQSGHLLLQAVPPSADLLGLKKDLDTLCGPDGHHELHVWALAPDHAIASLHLHCPGPEAYQAFLDQAQLLFKSHGIEEVTVQPEFGTPGPCTMACGPACTKHLCCGSQAQETKSLVLSNICA
ncbi:uncharacterized protein WCC33_014532 [Rhinophrynus dorsalis]